MTGNLLGNFVLIWSKLIVMLQKISVQNKAVKI